MCAIHAGRRGRRVLVMDHGAKIGGKILISGGGRCNFTNLDVTSNNFVSQNSHFAKSALSRYVSDDFIQMVRAHGIPFHEKKLGQLFCDRSAKDIVAMLQEECLRAQVVFRLPCVVQRVAKTETGNFVVETSLGDYAAASLVVATGGYSIPRMGATGLGFDIARQFGLQVTETAPALDGFILTDPQTKIFCELAGLSLDCAMSCGGLTFRENLLFTHVGISGPAALQASLHWRPGDAVFINLLPEIHLADWLLAQRTHQPTASLRKLLAEYFPARFLDLFLAQYVPQAEQPVASLSERSLANIQERFQAWALKPSSTVGYAKAEVTRGGVDTRELSSKTFESKKIPGLFFVGEVIDVTGWLGGYNFQWAWASGWAAAQVV